MQQTNFPVEPGSPHPLGARVQKDGVNFSVYSQHATSVELYLFGDDAAVEPMQIIKLEPGLNRSFYFWHCFVRGLKPGTNYAYRVDGSRDVNAGHRFNPNKLLIDPYAFGNTTTLWDRIAACGPEDNQKKAMRSVVIDLQNYDWEGDQPLKRPMNESIIYEIHVGGFSKSPTSGVKSPGKFLGIIEKIPYLKELGITAVELLPVMEFDMTEILRTNPDGKKLTNFWGYSTVGFFSPNAAYCCQPTEGAHINEFRDMVKALHQAGVEVILDVVFNHTNEGNHQGPTISFKGLDNKVYYHRVYNNEQYYMDYSGCGNTLNCNHPLVEKFIQDCLEFWVRDMHVDGFRFDEGSILCRMPDGSPSPMAPALWNIELAEALADTKLIAEAWDAAGLYQIGSFPGFRWAEWNGRFRDEIRSFVLGQPGMVGAVATRLAGSADLYEGKGRQTVNSINFITCHDGFTLNDLVSYNRKHNEANGENNQDGINDNLSWNYGWEGASTDSQLEAFRSRQCKNFVAILLLSQGVPMILGGDEIRRTQNGNNNAYCHDNEISWFNWNLTGTHADLLRFTQGMIAFRKRNRSLRRSAFFTGALNARGVKDIAWHGCQLNAPGWDDPSGRVLAFTLGSFTLGEPDIQVMLNMSDDALPFELPAVSGQQWSRFVDTALAAPDDLMLAGQEVPIIGQAYLVSRHSIVILVAG